jgi:tetratricopeptide (TPR) repeat protein
MIKTRLFLIGVSALVVWLLFQLPKVVVENENKLANEPSDSISSHIQSHVQAPAEVRDRIALLRTQIQTSTEKEKNAIFADSLASLYRLSSRYDSAAWFAEEASKFFNSTESWIEVADDYYQAYTLALDQSKQKKMAEKAQKYYGKVLEKNSKNLEIKTKMAMTYLSSPNPMQGITMLREVLAEDPTNELALFNMGMLSIQSGQYAKAVDWLEKLIKVNPAHIQGQLLYGLALMNSGEKKRAKEQFEKVKQMDEDPAVHATVNSYLKDLK